MISYYNDLLYIFVLKQNTFIFFKYLLYLMFNTDYNMTGETAPEFPEGYIWLNTTYPLSLRSLRGNVVLLDFWTYCCINCMHMLPILSNLEEKYKNKNFIVIGVHSAKFINEEEPANIKEAIDRYDIQHPVIVDESMHIWEQYEVKAWPTFVIIDPEQKILYRFEEEIPQMYLEKIIDKIIEKGRIDKVLSSKPPTIKKGKNGDKPTLFYYPGKLSFSRSKNDDRVAISDSNHNKIIIASIDNGNILDIIGNGQKGFLDGRFNESSFFRPQGILWIDEDTIFVADTENHAIRKIDLKKKEVTTIAGTGTQGGYIRYGAEVAGRTCSLSSPWDLAMYKDRVFIAMAGLHQIWYLDINSQKVSPYAGDGTENLVNGALMESRFAQPSGLSMEKDMLYVADSESSSIRFIDLKKHYTGTIVGKGLFEFGYEDGALNNAKLQHPIGIDSNNRNIYVADTYNNAIRFIDIEKREMKTIIGTKDVHSVCRFDDPHCDILGLYEPSDVKIHVNKLYIADTNNHLIRSFDMRTSLLKTVKLKFPI